MMLPLEPAWRRPMMTVYCAHEKDGERDLHLGCDGMFCGCPCHVARDQERWQWIRRWYFDEHPRAAASLPVGVL